MGSFREQQDRRQGFLLPPSPSDWLPEGYLAWFFIDAVEQGVSSDSGKLRGLRERVPHWIPTV